MKCLGVLVVVLLCGISGGYSRPQGFFGGLLPTAKPQGDSPPKGPLALLAQGQQSAQAAIGGFISGLAETREKIRNETKKRIQSLLNATMGNKGDAEVSSEKPEEAANPEKGEEEALPEQDLDKNKEGSTDIETTEGGSAESLKQSEVKEEEEPEMSSEKEEIPESNDKTQTQEKFKEEQKEPEDKVKLDPQQNKDSAEKSSTETTTDNSDLDKIIEEVFSTDPSKDSGKEENSDGKEKTIAKRNAREFENSITEQKKENNGFFESFFSILLDTPEEDPKKKTDKDEDSENDLQ